MKKIVLLAFLLSCFAMTYANTIKIKVVDFQFKAKTVNALVGDTIIWIWKSGIHTTTSTTIPANAKAWNRPIDSAHLRFKYILKVYLPCSRLITSRIIAAMESTYFTPCSFNIRDKISFCDLLVIDVIDYLAALHDMSLEQNLAKIYDPYLYDEIKANFDNRDTLVNGMRLQRF